MSSAQSVANSSFLSDAEPSKSVFYGSKASQGSNNPCKGATIRKCGEIYSKIIAVSDGESLVQQTVKDADNQVLEVRSYIEEKEPDEVVKEIKLETIRKGGTWNEENVNK